MKLMSMITFYQLLYGRLLKGEITPQELISIYYNYTQFLLQPLELWMFVPCDEDGNIFETPNTYTNWTDEKWDNYTKAKGRVLFEGAELIKKSPHYDHHIRCGEFFIYINSISDVTIESLIRHRLTLTKTAQQEIGL